jgi:hypothetical protein
MSQATELRVVSVQALAVGTDLREHQVVELVDSEGRRIALYSRYLAPDGTRWVRHGLYQAFYPSGGLKSEGTYSHGTTDGSWRDLYENGVVAAQGWYEGGEHVGTWRYWNTEGRPEQPEEFRPSRAPIE